MWILFQKNFWSENPYNEGPYEFTAEYVLKQRATFSYKRCIIVESLENHNLSGFTSNNKSAQTQVLYFCSPCFKDEPAKNLRIDAT